MSLICLASVKGAPGVTLTAIGLAAAWPQHDGERKVLLEADGSGGSLAVRYQLGRQPGLITLAAAAGHGLGRNDLWSHAQELPGGLPVVVAPERGDRTTAILASSGIQLGGWLASLGDVNVIADCGRIGVGANSGLVGQADRLFVVARPTAEQIQPAAVIAQAAVHAGIDTSWVLIGDTPHSAAEVQNATGIAVAWVLPDDPSGAAAITAGQATGRRRGRLARSFGAWAQELAEPAVSVEPEQPEEVPDLAEEPIAAMLGEVAR